ncbi:hypothetical protein [Streptomyces sp. WAC 01325]|uniref:hypothetical protein n=1 Tax=Streptomyces sp. WAC 01325 TaxID=2203202 RepID=UPI00163C0C20|nr:hypothetical protein [Streptomyces sp. WAC 01325]
MAKRREKKPDPNDEQQLGITLDPFTQLPITTVEPRTTPIPEKPRRRGKKAK